MSLSNGIQQFLAGVDPVILSRGQDYFRSGNVESIKWDDRHVTAEVSGSEDEPYLVEIDFNEDGEVEAWECDCPYDWGPVCKHTAAALLAIQAEPPKEETQEGDARKISIRDLVERAEKEQLAELILLAANVWMNPMIFDSTVEESCRKFMIFGQMLRGFGLDIVDDEMLARLRELTSIYQRNR